MYCPVCFQNTLRIKSTGVIKLAFNGKSKNSSIFTYNLQKESQDQLIAKLREKIEDFFRFYADFQNKAPLKNFEAYAADFLCENNCKIDMINTKVSVVGVIYSASEVKSILTEYGKKYAIDIEVNFNH